LLGLLARQSGQHDSAIRLAARAVELRPANAGFEVSLAQAYLAAGDLQNAEASCRRSLELQPGFGVAWCCIGDIEGARGRVAEARLAWEKAVGLTSKSGRAEKSLGHLLCRQGRWDEAIEMYRAGLCKSPRDAVLHYALGAALAVAGKKPEARAAYREALHLRPRFPEVLLSLGNLDYDEGAFVQAAICCRKALVLRPGYAKAWCNLGNALQMLGQARIATACYERTLAIDPKTVAAQHNLGNAWLGLREYRRAEDCFRRALATEGQARHYSSLGNALFHQRRDEEAAACYRRALELEPEFAAAHTNLGNVLMRLGDGAAMILHYERALELDPGSAGGHYNLALAYLRQGRYEEGWREHEWRWDFRELRLQRRRFAAPQWRGEELGGETILLHAEQGLGDTLQFVRYAPPVAERGGRVVLEVQPGLKRLLENLPGCEKVIGHGEPLPEFRWHCPLMSLPLAFGGSLETIPARIPYVYADDAEAEAAGRRWPGKGLRVGIAWAGNPKHKSDDQRSMPLRALVALAEVPGISWFSLQKGAAAEQMRGVAAEFPLVAACSASLDFAETAALVATLDVVISVDTAIAHLAGAMGKPAWVILPHLADWRWMDEREDSDWYPTARLFRQKVAGDWRTPVARMRDELRRLVAVRGALRGNEAVEVGAEIRRERVGAGASPRGAM
jgi:tetratricopeptide (TPR) repeat protein